MACYGRSFSMGPDQIRSRLKNYFFLYPKNHLWLHHLENGRFDLYVSSLAFSEDPGGKLRTLGGKHRENFVGD
jgi:hypothetical protein